MPYSAPRTWVANVTAITAAALNTDLRDNLNYHQGLLDGTGSGNVTVPDALIVDDTNLRLFMSGGNPWLQWDATDFLVYNRASNLLILQIGGSNVLLVDSAGKLTGTGFYASSITTIANTVNGTFTHGLGARPRFIGGFRAAVGVTPAIPVGFEFASGSICRFTNADNSAITVNNQVGSSQDVIVFAML